MSLVTPTPAK